MKPKEIWRSLSKDSHPINKMNQTRVLALMLFLFVVSTSHRQYPSYYGSRSYGGGRGGFDGHVGYRRSSSSVAALIGKPAKIPNFHVVTQEIPRGIPSLSSYPLQTVGVGYVPVRTRPNTEGGSAVTKESTGFGLSVGAGGSAGTGGSVGVGWSAGFGWSIGAGLSAGVGGSIGAGLSAGTGGSIGAGLPAGTGGSVGAGLPAGTGGSIGVGLSAGTGGSIGAGLPAGTGGSVGTGVSTGGGICPPVRDLCTAFRTSPPSCTSDAQCSSGTKCCFDSCVQRDICKSVI